MGAPARNTIEALAFAPDLRLVPAQAGAVIDLPVVPADEHAAMGIVSVGGIEARFRATKADIPWLSADTSVPLRMFNLVRGTSILYGSVVSANHTLEKLADKVDRGKSKQVETALFTSLPDWLMQYDMPAITAVDKPLCAGSLYRASRGSHDPARLFFIRKKVDGMPAVIKVAVARHKDQGQAMNILSYVRRHKQSLAQSYNG